MGRRRDRGQARFKANPVAAGSPSATAVPGSAVEAPARPGGSWRTRLEFGSAMLLLMGLGLHLGLRVRPELNYERFLPPFFWEMRFLEKHFSMPGGLLQYGASGFAHCQFTDAWGAATFTMLLALAFLSAQSLVASVRQGASVTLACVWVALLAALPGRFEGDAIGTVLGCAVAAGAGVIWALSIERSVWVRVIGCWTLGAVVFWSAGALPMTLFAALALVLELTRHGRPWPALACALVVLVIPAWWRVRIGFDPSAVMANWGQGWTRGLHAAAFLWLPIGLLLSAVTRRSRLRFWQREETHWLIAGGRVLAGLALVWATVNVSRKIEAQVAYAAGHGHWEAAVEHGRSVPTWSASTRLHVLRALHHLGRLPEDLFSFPQRRGVPVLPGYQEGLEMGRPLAWTLLELGQVNLAEHMAHEALELEGARPDTLRLLARVNMLLDRPGAARIFLNRLGLVPFCRAEVEAALARLTTDPQGLGDTVLARIRSCLPRTDEPDPALPAESLLRQLLAANPTNGMAWNYLQSHWLLSGQLDALAAASRGRTHEALDRWSRPCLEALLLRQDLAPGTAPVLGAGLDHGLKEAYRRFGELVRQHGEDTPAARVVIGAEFGNTYWYYHRFGETIGLRSVGGHAQTP